MCLAALTIIGLCCCGPVWVQAVLIRVPADQPTLQAAVDHAVAGDLIEVDAAAGPYSGFVLETSGVSLRSIAGRALIVGAGRGQGITVEIRGDHVEFSGFELRDGDVGLFLNGASQATLRDNVVVNNDIGIDLLSSGGNTLSGNVSRHNRVGIRLLLSFVNALRDNTASDNGEAGIVIGGEFLTSNSNTLMGNVAERNGTGIFLDTADNNTLIDNKIRDNETGVNLLVANGNALLDNAVTDNAVGLRLVYANKNLLARNLVQNNDVGVKLGFKLFAANGNTLVQNRVRGNRVGVSLSGSKDNALLRNAIRDNDVGIQVENGATDNPIQRNNIVGNKVFGLQNLSAEVVEAHFNFWGKASGPSHAQFNPQGQGDAISDRVAFDPWLSENSQIL